MIKVFLFLTLLLFSKNIYSSDHVEIYVCELLLDEDTKKSPMLRETTPLYIQVNYNPTSNILEEFYWQKKSQIEYFYVVNNSSKNRIDIWRKGYGMTLSKDDVENGLYFEIDLTTLKAHMYMQFIPGINYQCKKL